MEIKWLGHSSFRIKSKTTTIITDPYPPDMGYNFGKQTADIVTVSHDHPDHSYVEAVSGNFRKLYRPGEYEIGDAIILGLATYHDSEKGIHHGKNIVFLFEIEEMAVCHLGDLGEMLTASEIEELGKIDVLMLPVGGKDTLSVANAAKLVRQLEPAVVIPMHYRASILQSDLEPVEAFLKEFGTTDIKPQPKLTVTRSSLPLTTQVVLLEA